MNLEPILERTGTETSAGNETGMGHWRFYASGFVESPRTFFGHASPPGRTQHPNAHNCWFDVLYNFGAASMLPLANLLLVTIRQAWKHRAHVLFSPMVLGTTTAALYLLAENLLRIGMRQPYPGIITFFIWGLPSARLYATTSDEKSAPALP